MLMLRVVLALAGAAGCFGREVLTGGVTAGRLASGGTAGLMVSGEAAFITDGEVEGGAEGMSVTVVDLVGAGLMGGTFMDDIITTAGGGVTAGTVLTTTDAVDFGGSKKQTVRVNPILFDVSTSLYLHTT